MPCCETVRSIDLFGVPVSLVYKGEKEFKTRFGGCISILFIVFIVCFLIEEIIAVKFLGREFSAKIEEQTNYYEYDSAKLTLDDSYSMMGELSFTFDDELDPIPDMDSIARIQFYELSHLLEEDGKYHNTYEYIPAIYCHDKYADFIAENPDN